MKLLTLNINVMGKFVISKAKNGVVFNLKAGNGEIIATSEVYSSLYE